MDLDQMMQQQKDANDNDQNRQQEPTRNVMPPQKATPQPSSVPQTPVDKQTNQSAVGTSGNDKRDVSVAPTLNNKSNEVEMTKENNGTNKSGNQGSNVSSNQGTVTNAANNNQPSTVPQHIDIHVDRGDDEYTVKKKKTHGFWRNMTIFVLLVTGTLLLLDILNIFSLQSGSINFMFIYALIVILSTFILFSFKTFFGKIGGIILFLLTLGGLLTIGMYHTLRPSTLPDHRLIHNVENTKTINLRINAFVAYYDITQTNKKEIQFDYLSDRNIGITSGVVDDITTLTLDETADWNIMHDFHSMFTIKLPTDKKTTMYHKSFIGHHTIDLTNIQREEVVLHGGYTNSLINVGKNFSNTGNITIKGGYTKLHLLLPKTVGIQLNTKQLAGSLALPDFQEVDGIYQSNNRSTAAKQLTVDVVGGVTKVSVTRQ